MLLKCSVVVERLQFNMTNSAAVQGVARTSDIMWSRGSRLTMLILSVFPSRARGLATPYRITTLHSTFGVVPSTHSDRCLKIASAAAPTAAEESSSRISSYSPPELVEVLRDASGQSQPLGVEKIFSALSGHQGFMNEVRAPHDCMYNLEEHQEDWFSAPCPGRLSWRPSLVG